MFGEYVKGYSLASSEWILAGAWRSLVARFHGVEEVARSNRVAPTRDRCPYRLGPGRHPRQFLLALYLVPAVELDATGREHDCALELRTDPKNPNFGYGSPCNYLGYP